MPIMKRKSNLLDSTGMEWFRSRVVGCHMLYKGDVVRVDRIMDENHLRAVSLVSGKNVLVPKGEMAGFSALAYPQLGYRKLADNVAVFFERQHNYYRGLRHKSVKYTMSPVSDLIVQRYPGRVELDRVDNAIMLSVFQPNYDKPEALDALLAGQKLNVVLNHNVLIEPSVAPQDDDHVVYFRQRACGRLNDNKEFKWYSPLYREAVAPLLGNYGVHK